MIRQGTALCDKCPGKNDTERGNFTHAVNFIAKMAYDEGFEYFVRLTDDAVFVSKYWTT